MKHTKFIPSEFSKGLGLRDPKPYETKNGKMIKDWIRSLNARECVVTESSLKKCLVCWLHGHSAGVRDEEFGFYMECIHSPKSMTIEVWPLRDRPDGESYIEW